MPGPALVTNRNSCDFWAACHQRTLCECRDIHDHLNSWPGPEKSSFTGFIKSAILACMISFSHKIWSYNKYVNCSLHLYIVSYNFCLTKQIQQKQKMLLTKVPVKWPLRWYQNCDVWEDGWTGPLGFIHGQRWSMSPLQYKKHLLESEVFCWVWRRIFTTSNGVTEK